MRRRFVLPAIVVMSMSLVACGNSTSSSDTVPQPDPKLSDANTADPGAGEAEAQAAAAACNSGKPISGRPLRIASTVAPITNLVGAIVGSTGTIVNGIVPEGTNSHTYEPPPSAAVNFEKADAVFVNGLYLDDPARDLAASTSKSLICEIGTAILPKTGWIYDFSFPKEAGKPNPHVWTNPPMVLSMLTTIRDVLATMDPANAASYDDNYVKISSVVMQLDAAMIKATETIPANQRKLLTYHDAYAYFAQHFEYDVIGAIQPSSFQEPSPTEIADLIAQVKSYAVKAIFGSEVFPSSIMEQIGKETGVRYVDTLRDDDLPGKPGDVDHSWAGLMKLNFITMVEALGGDASAIKAVNIDTKVPDKATYPQ